MRRRPICTRPTRRRCSARRRTRRRSPTARKVDDPRRRAEPDRAGDRVRLLLLPRRLRARRDGAGFETIMVNCNPETVSTDPDTSDRLYFEPLTAEDVLEIVARESGAGRAARRHRPARRADAAQARRRAAGGGGADPRHLARQHRPRRGPRALRQAGRRSSASSSRANGIARSRDEALAGGRADRLSGAAAAVLRARRARHGGGRRARSSSTIISPPRWRCRAPSPVLIDRYLRDAIEVDVDAICDGTDVVVAGVLQHIEEAGRPFGRQRLLDPAAQPAASRSSPRSSGRRAALALALEGQGADERPVRGQGRARSI